LAGLADCWRRRGRGYPVRRALSFSSRRRSRVERCRRRVAEVSLRGNPPTAWVSALQLGLYEVDPFSEPHHSLSLCTLQPQGPNDVLRQAPARQGRATGGDDLPAAQPLGYSARVNGPPLTQLRKPACELLLLHSKCAADLLDLLGPLIQRIPELVDQFLVRSLHSDRSLPACTSASDSAGHGGACSTATCTPPAPVALLESREHSRL
jgi:hypothetical protein